MTITWSPTDKYASVALSNGNLTATGDGTTTFEAGRASAAGSGKLYFELLVAAMPSGSTGFSLAGIDDGTGSLSGFIGSGAGGHGYRPSDGAWFTNGGPAGGGANAAFVNVGDRLLIAFDTAAKLIWAGVNGTWGVNGFSVPMDPAAGTGGQTLATSGPFFPAYSLNGVTSYTACLTAASQSYAAPSGFAAFDTSSGGGGGTSSIVFRKTFSSIGTRAGKRQPVGN